MIRAGTTVIYRVGKKTAVGICEVNIGGILRIRTAAGKTVVRPEHNVAIKERVTK